MGVDDHRSAAITNDGGAPYARRYRYVCKCGKSGEWRATEQLAKNDHFVHKHTSFDP